MSIAHMDAKTVGLDMPRPDKSMPVTTNEEVELEGEQAIPLHRHGFETVVFQPVSPPTKLKRFLMMDSCVLFRGRGSVPAAVAAMDI